MHQRLESFIGAAFKSAADIAKAAGQTLRRR